MVQKTSLVLALLFAIVIHFHGATIASAQTEGVELQWKFSEGQKLSIEMEQNIVMEMSGMGQDTTSNNVTNTWMTWKVDSIDDEGIATVKNTIDRMTMNLQNPGGTFEIDTDNEDDGSGQSAQSSSPSAL